MMTKQISWQKAIEVFDKILPDYQSFTPKRKVFSESFQKKIDEMRAGFNKNRARLIREGKIPDLANRFYNEDQVRFAVENKLLAEEEIWGDWVLELEEDEIIEKLFGVDLVNFNLQDEIIMIHMESYPRVSKTYEDCDYEHRKPYIIHATSFLKDIEDFHVTVFDGDVQFLNPSTGLIIIFHHEGAKFVIKGNAITVNEWFYEY
ncbi:MAG: hypothetical protein AAFQ94_13920 [Bacteroidota bacterium]